MTDPEVFHKTSGEYDFVVRFTMDNGEMTIGLKKSELQYLTNAGDRELEGDW